MTPVTVSEFAEDGDELATLIKWNVREGETVAEGDEILELLTDKATFTVPAPCSGVVRRIVVPEGTEVRSTDLLAEIDEKACASSS